MPGQKRGPKRKPVEATRPILAEGGWKRPSHLKGNAALGWDHLVSLLRAGGNLGRTDPTLVECYATNYGLLRDAQADLSANGTTNLAANGRRFLNPAAQLVNVATMRLKGIANDLGLM